MSEKGGGSFPTQTVSLHIYLFRSFFLLRKFIHFHDGRRSTFYHDHQYHQFFQRRRLSAALKVGKIRNYHLMLRSLPRSLDLNPHIFPGQNMNTPYYWFVGKVHSILCYKILYKMVMHCCYNRNILRWKSPPSWGVLPIFSSPPGRPSPSPHFVLPLPPSASLLALPLPADVSKQLLPPLPPHHPSHTHLLHL